MKYFRTPTAVLSLPLLAAAQVISESYAFPSRHFPLASMYGGSTASRFPSTPPTFRTAPSATPPTFSTAPSATPAHSSPPTSLQAAASDETEISSGTAELCEEGEVKEVEDQGAEVPSTDPDPAETEANKTTHANHEFLKEALLRNVIFTNLPEESLEALINAFEPAEYNRTDQEIIIRQGDSCQNDYVYLLHKGQCTVQRDGKVIPRPYGTLESQSIFGELGVLYNRTRAATISCRTPTVSVFRIRCEEFQEILNNQRTTNQLDLETDAMLDNAIQQIEGTRSLYEGNIIQPYKPDRLWLWSRFKGTVLQHVSKPTLLNMLWSVCFIVFARCQTVGASNFWEGIGKAPDASHPFIAKLKMVQKIWGYQQGLTTFILTFFLNQAFGFWQEIYDIGRNIQGRLNDFNLILATTATRNKRDGSFTAKSETLLDDVAQYSRLFHALFWASNARRFRILQSNKGLERMASRGLMTSKQLEALLSLDLPEDQRHSACLEWMLIRTEKGIQDGTLISDPAHRQYLITKIVDLRATFACIGDKMSGRMPLAYTHMVQVLVDSFVLFSPVALYAEMGAWSVVCVGVLTVFYTGLMDLAKIFLDPLDNEDFCRNSIDMDLGVLIRESNAGSTRWKRGAARLPF